MLAEIILFAAFFTLGSAARLWHKSLMLLEGKMKNRPAAVTLEFLSMGLLISAYVILLFVLNDGLFVPYTLFGVAIGFLATSVAV